MQKVSGNGSAAPAANTNTNAGGQVYSFPLLKPSEIFACVREMQIPVAEDEIRNCDPGAIRKVLEVFIENIMGVTREEMNQPAFAGLSALSYPELHEDSIPELAFFRTATKLLTACGVYDFGLKDILTPTPKRVRRQLSALINFAKFREERLAAFSELTRETDHLIKKKMSLQEENELLQRQLNDLLQEHEAEAPAIKQITEETAQLETEINVLNKRQAVMRHETSELKNKNNELRDEMTSYQFNILEAEKEIERLRGKIVNSPERVKKEIESIAVSLEDAKEEVNAMERRHRELLAYSDTFARTEKDMLKTIELMRDAEQDIQKCKDAKEQVKMQKKEIAENERKTVEIIAQRKRMEKLVEQKRELFERYKEESRIKDQAADQALKAAQEELHQLESANSDVRQRIAANNEGGREIERKMREDELKYQKELQEIQQMYSRLQLAAQYYNTELLKAIHEKAFAGIPTRADSHSDRRAKTEEREQATMTEEVAAPVSPGKADSAAEILDEDGSSILENHQLARPLHKWEISRDHLIFSEICGLDTGKRHIIHFLEPRKDSVHGGIILTAAGNTVQILTLAPFSTENKQRNERRNAILERRYLFGFGGGGIGSLAVHPSKRFFAVGEKGIKPNITIYRYPSAKVCGVLRNGTEFSYSSIVFSQDGEKLASVGGAPDYLLSVWNWRQQQTILRCKAFGQDVFSVQFAPNDSGFLATSGVGHIRMWRMASTFTGLKLQGDIGKFGKSELSDIEAFCVLPDKKVLSGTERGVLLLWDGNFIKCEILTSRRHAPHNGAINVVDYGPDESQIVTAGRDGYVRFWSFDTIDRADVPPDDTVALVPMKKQILIEPLMDIRSVIKESASRYLIQDGKGSVHLLVMEGEESYVERNYLPNDTGRATGITCSPYEHLAASCGDDGSIRAWDYVKKQVLFGAVTSSSTANNTAAEGGSTLSSAITPAAATVITWVPSPGALITEHVVESRQVAVGFSDGLIRVFLMDLVKRIWVRTNVFKPHRERVPTNCTHFSLFHDYSAHSSGGSESNGSSSRLQLALSFDDSFVLAAGCDGNLSICRLHHDKLEFSARILSDKYDNLLAEAKIVGDQAMEKQKAQMDLLQKALADEKNNGDDTGGMANAVNSLGSELTSLPSFHRAKAYSSYLSSKLEASDDSSPPTATDDEIFRGVVRLVSDPDSEVGLVDAAFPLDDAEAPTGSLLNLLEVPDIQNPRDAYTIEDAKLKSEADAKGSATKTKQDRTRDVVHCMRKQLQELKALNATYPPESRLDDSEWEIDLDYGELLTKIGDAACEEVRKELAYAVEREELLLMKMRETHVSPLAVELITLHAFENGLSVQSFRTMKMAVVLQKRLNEIHTNDSSEARRVAKKATASAMNDPSGANSRSSTGNGAVLLEQFESKENLLSSKLNKSKSEKAQVVAEINEIQENLSNKKKEHEEWSKQEKAIQSEFLTTVNGNSGSTQHPNFAALQKIFKKKIKRPKKKPGANGAGKEGKDGGDGDANDPSRENENADDDDDEEEDDDDGYDENDDDDDDEDDVCPPGCDLQLYEKVLAVREKRADVDDAMSDLTKAMEELKKSNERQVAKQRQIDKELQATEHDIQQFQSEKQTRFNQLDVVVALSKHQIRCLESRPGGKWEVPEQSANCLVFTMQSFDNLAERIDSLQKENKSLRQQFKDLHKQQNLLAREKKVQQGTIADIQHRCEQLQLLKFGQLVDIEVLDKACDTTKLNDLQAKVRVKEIENEREVLKVKQSQQQLKLQILQATEQNTALLSRIAELNERQFALEKELNQANVSQSVLNDDTELLEQEMRERNKLAKLVKLQSREVEALKQEIGLLRGKDGKVYAPRM